MKQVKPRFKHTFFQAFIPTYHVQSVQDIDITKLKKNNIKAIIFDADSTIVEQGHIVVSPEVLNFLKEIPIPIYIATNRLSPRGEELATLIQAKAVMHASVTTRKPQRRYFSKLESLVGLPLSSTVMVGDRLYNDIYGGNRAGMKTIFVDALGRDHIYMRWTGIRKLELMLLNFFSKK